MSSDRLRSELVKIEVLIAQAEAGMMLLRQIADPASEPTDLADPIGSLALWVAALRITRDSLLRSSSGLPGDPGRLH